MASKNGRDLNITIKNVDDEKGEAIVTFSTLIKKLRKYLLIWVIVAAVAAAAILGMNAFDTTSKKRPVKALVSFTYDGIEKGLDPAGNVFDINMIKNPTVIEDALTELDLPLEDVDNVIRNISFKQIIPSDAIDKITVYKSVYENANSGNLSAAQAMLDVTYHPTEYTVILNYTGAGYNADTGMEVLNAVLDNFRSYFYKKYGYNTALGTAVPAVDYDSYDYGQQIDVFKSTIQTLEKYLKALYTEDTTLFRSTETGYTFNDLYQAALTIEALDLDRISSYITSNNLTKDKESSIAYCDYRIAALNREKDQLTESLASIEESIAGYEKDTILIFGNGTDGNDTSYSQASVEYDNLIQLKVDTATELATTKQNIKYYEERKSALQNSKTGTPSQVEQVEQQLSDLNDKITDLVSKTELTANEYYENVAFNNAYNILVPAVGGSSTTVNNIVEESTKPLVLFEGFLLIVYLVIATIEAMIADSKVRKAAEAAAAGADNEDSEDEAVTTSVAIEKIADAIDEAENKKKKK